MARNKPDSVGAASASTIRRGPINPLGTDIKARPEKHTEQRLRQGIGLVAD